MIKHFKVAKNNIKLQSIITIVSVLVNTLTFFLLTVFLTFALLSNFILGFLESRAQLTAYFQDTVDEAYILEVKGELASMGEVSDVTYTSKSEALEIFLSLYESEPLLTESVDAGIFPASLDVRVNDINDLDMVAEKLRQKDGVEEISFFKEALEKFKSWSNGLKYIGLSLVGVMLGISFLIILVVAGVTIREKSEEIRVTRLLGATDAYIVGPYFAQSVIISFLSSIFSMTMFLAVVPFIEPFLLNRFAGIPIPPLSFMTILYIFGLQLLVNLAISSLGTLVAVKKYMNL